MEKELKEYLDRITSDLADFKNATEKELAEIKETMATKKDLQKTERKLTKKIGENTDYIKFIDEELSSHRRNTEAHNTGLKKA